MSELPAGTPYGAEITAAAKANGVDPALLAGLVKQESGFNPKAGSGAGAKGLTQLMPATAAGLGVTDVFDPVQSLNGGAKYLKQQLDAFGGDVTKALAAYNAGPGAVQRFGGVPPYSETQNYVRIVQANAASFRSAPSTTRFLRTSLRDLGRHDHRSHRSTRPQRGARAALAGRAPGRRQAAGRAGRHVLGDARLRCAARRSGAAPGLAACQPPRRSPAPEGRAEGEAGR